MVSSMFLLYFEYCLLVAASFEELNENPIHVQFKREAEGILQFMLLNMYEVSRNSSP